MVGAISKQKCATSYTLECSNLELHWRRWWDDRAQRVGESAQSQMMMCAHRCCLVLETSSKEYAMSELKMSIRTQCKMLQSRLILDAMVRSSSAIGARLHNAILVIFLVGRRCHLLSRVGDIIFVSGIPTYGRTVTNKRLTPSTALAAQGAADLVYDVVLVRRALQTRLTTWLQRHWRIWVMSHLSECKICHCKICHVPVIFCKVHDVAEAACRREARKEMREGCHLELLSA